MRRLHRSKPVLTCSPIRPDRRFPGVFTEFVSRSFRTYCSFAYSALASFRMGMSGQRLFKRWRLVRFKRQADAAQQVLKARVSAKGIQLGVGGDPGRAVRALVEGFSQPQES